MGVDMKVTVKINKSNQKGMASIEALPLLVIFVVMISYGLGLFGFIHSGILYSISARTYAFETFRNRTNLVYFRDLNNSIPEHYQNFGFRFHGIQSETTTSVDDFYASQRPIAIGRDPGNAQANVLDHNENIYKIDQRNREGGVSVSPGWVMVGYGICLNLNCGD